MTKIDDFFLHQATRFVSASRGVWRDKFALLRDVNFALSVICLLVAYEAWPLWIFTLAFAVLSVNHVIIGNQNQRKIGSAETARGYQKAASDASKAVEGRRFSRLFNLFIFAVISTLSVAFVFHGGRTAYENVVSFIYVALFFLQAVAAYIEAAMPSLPGHDQRRISATEGAHSFR